MNQTYRKRLFLWTILANGVIGASVLLIASRHAETPHPSFHTAAAAHVPPAPAAARVSKAKLLFDESELAGKYYFGDGLGVNCSLELRINHRFDFHWHGCEGEYDRNQGTWALDGDVMVLKPERPNRCEGFRGMSVRLVPVQWGRRYLLIDENEMCGFWTSAAWKAPPTEEHVHDYIKVAAGGAAPVRARPLIPERYREFYQRGAIEAKVVRINSDGTVTLNKGSRNRLKPGLLMAIVEYEPINLEVVTVSEREAVAKLFYFWNSSRWVRVGDQFTTGGEWNRPRGTGFQRLSAPPIGKEGRESQRARRN